MNLRICLVLGTILSTQVIYSMGLGEWSHKTKYGTYFDGTGSTKINCKSEVIEFVREWYYYKSYIVGNCGSYNQADSFFILDEKNCRIQIFTKKENWEKSIFQSGLEPIFWTRWYQIHDDVGWLILGSLWFITIPVFFLICLILYSISKAAVKVFKLPDYSIKLLTLISISIFFFLENTYQSF